MPPAPWAHDMQNLQHISLLWGRGNHYRRWRVTVYRACASPKLHNDFRGARTFPTKLTTATPPPPPPAREDSNLHNVIIHKDRIGSCNNPVLCCVMRHETALLRVSEDGGVPDSGRRGEARRGFPLGVLLRLKA